MGTNALGGPIWDSSVRSDGPVGYGEVDESTALKTIRAAFDAGVTFFDTADEYGCGRAERLLGTALRGRRSEVVLATKFGHTFEEANCTVTGSDASPDALRRACEASLRRLGTDVIDLYLLHLRDLAIPAAAEVRDTLECLVSEGKIRFYGWSTDDVARARFFAEGEHCAAVEHRLNIFLDAVEMLEICDERGAAPSRSHRAHARPLRRASLPRHPHRCVSRREDRTRRADRAGIGRRRTCSPIPAFPTAIPTRRRCWYADHWSSSRASNDGGRPRSAACSLP
jgi:hypothetical protein